MSQLMVGELDPVLVRLKLDDSGVIELPLESKDCFEKTIGQLKKEQFSSEELVGLSFIHEGT